MAATDLASSVVAAGSTLAVPVAGHAGVPASGVGSALLTLTATNAAGSGRLTAYAAGTARPAVTSLQFSAGIASSNQVWAQVGSAGAVAVHNSSSAAVTLTATITGYTTSGAATAPGSYGAVTPSRLATATIPARGYVMVPLAGRRGVPADAADAVLEIATPAPAHSGTITALPSGGAAPDAPALTFFAGTGHAALNQVALGRSGAATLHNPTPHPVTVTVDVLGYHLPGTASGVGAFHALPPARWIDTRAGLGLPKNRVPAGQTVPVIATGRSGIPDEGVRALVVGVQVITPTKSGSVDAYATGDQTQPAAHAPVVTFAGGVTRQTATAVVDVGDGGKINLVNRSAGSVDLVADMIGYLLDPPGFTWSPPRAADLPGEESPAPSCVSASFCAAVDGANTFSWNGSGWTRQVLTDPGASLQAVSCATTSFCAAVDAVGNALIFDGARWSAPQHIVDVVLTSVSCPSVGFCVAVDAGDLTSGGVHSPEAIVYRNGAWGGRTTLSSTVLSTVSCASAEFCVAGDNGGDVIVFDGKTWGQPIRIFTNGNRISSLSCPTATFCAGVTPYGDPAVYLHGSTWTVDAHVYLGSNVSCVSPTFCLTASPQPSAATPAYYQVYDGISWVSHARAQDQRDGVVDCARPTFCAELAAHVGSTFDGTTWTDRFGVTGSHTARGQAVDCTSPFFCMASDSGATTAYHGGGWAPSVTQFDPSPAEFTSQGPLSPAGCSSPSLCVSAYGRLYQSPDPDEPVSLTVRGLSYRAGMWQTDSALASTWAAVSCVRGTLWCFALGVSGTVIEDDVQTGNVHVPTGEYSSQSLSCGSTTFCVAVLRSGSATVFNGASFGPADPIDAGHSLTGMSCAAGTHTCVAVDDAGRALRYDGSDWSAPAAVDTVGLTAVSCASPTMCVAVDGSGRAYRFDGATWTGPTKIDDAGLVSVSCPRTDFCMAVDDAGFAVVGH